MGINDENGRYLFMFLVESLVFLYFLDPIQVLTRVASVQLFQLVLRDLVCGVSEVEDPLHVQVVRERLICDECGGLLYYWEEVGEIAYLIPPQRILVVMQNRQTQGYDL
jgi:hypothetical protein